MLNSPIPSAVNDDPTSDQKDDQIDRIVEAGPRGAIVLAGIATFIVVALWVAFYLFVFAPRGVTP